jgi:hypothetical protein
VTGLFRARYNSKVQQQSLAAAVVVLVVDVGRGFLAGRALVEFIAQPPQFVSLIFPGDGSYGQEENGTAKFHGGLVRNRGPMGFSHGGRNRQD